MHEDYKDFDLKLRSMLQDAEVKPRRRVWKSISKQLDAAGALGGSVSAGASRGEVIDFGAASRRKSAWYGWAGAAFTVVAGLALALVLTGTQDQEVQLYTRSALKAQSAEIKLLPISKSRPLLAESRRRVELKQEVYTLEDNTVEPDIQQSESQKSSQQDGESSIKSFLKKYRTFESDPFAEMDAEERASAAMGRTAVYAKGLIGANEGGLMAFRGLSSLAPGVTETGIVELGESSFGIPLTLGLGVRFYLAPRLSLATGLDVSLLSRSFTGKFGTEAGNISHSMVYLGVPANLYYDVFESNWLKFYVYGGAEIEYCVSNKYTIHTTPKQVQSSKVSKPLFSLGAGLGVEFGLSKSLGLYVDPGLRYYFPSDQPRSVRTDKALSISFDAGLRFNF